MHKRGLARAVVKQEVAFAHLPQTLDHGGMYRRQGSVNICVINLGDQMLICPFAEGLLDGPDLFKEFDILVGARVKLHVSRSHRKPLAMLILQHIRVVTMNEKGRGEYGIRHNFDKDVAP
jgi:hypothetical protein